MKTLFLVLILASSLRAMHNTIAHKKNSQGDLVVKINGQYEVACNTIKEDVDWVRAHKNCEELTQEELNRYIEIQERYNLADKVEYEDISDTWYSPLEEQYLEGLYQECQEYEQALSQIDQH